MKPVKQMFEMSAFQLSFFYFFNDGLKKLRAKAEILFDFFMQAIPHG